MVNLATLSRPLSVYSFFLIVTIDNIVYSPNTGGETWITSDGRVYFAYITDDGQHTASSLKPTNSSQVPSSSCLTLLCTELTLETQ